MWDGRYYDASNTYTYLYHTAQGCDSLVTMHLTIYPTYNHTIEATICEGKSYFFVDEYFSVEGEYTKDLYSVHGCDSTVTLHLTVTETIKKYEFADICQGDTYYFYGTPVSTDGEHTHFIPSTGDECDTLVILTLHVHPHYRFEETVTFCDGGSINFFGEMKTTTGTYTKDFHSAFGCDSTYVLYLTVYPKYETPKTVQIEEDETYNFYGTILSTPGIYTHKLYSVHGCDSVIKLTLMVVTTKAVIIATSGPGGRITPAGVIKIPFGNSQAFYFTPDPGYKIESVIVDGVNITAAVLAGTYTFVNLQSNHTIHVTFVTDEITITATAGPNGTITPAGVIKIAEGKSQAFTFKPATNYKIEKVLVDGVNNATAVSTGMYTFSKITESHTIHVTFVSKVAAALAVDDSNWSKEVEVYTYLNTVYITIPNTSHPIVVDIFDMMGRHLHQRTLTDATTAIPLNVATGIYMIRLISQNEIIMVNKVSLTKF